MSNQPWWRGARGEWYVAGQIVLLTLIIAGPRTVGGWPPWTFLSGILVDVAGVALMVTGGCVSFIAMRSLGAGLTPLPHPNAQAELKESGIYRMVRHPIYFGVLLGGLGWALVGRGWLTILYVVLGGVFLDIKARREEQWLVERFPGYAAYRLRVRKLIPFVY